MRDGSKLIRICSATSTGIFPLVATKPHQVYFCPKGPHKYSCNFSIFLPSPFLFLTLLKWCLLAPPPNELDVFFVAHQKVGKVAT